MKKILCTVLFSAILFSYSEAQTIGAPEARELIERSLSYLKSSDTSSFVKLWHIDNAKWPYHQKSFTEQDVKENYAMLKSFLDTALARNLKISNMDIEKYNPKDTVPYFADFKVTVWFKYTNQYSKGISYFVEYYDHQWMVRFNPETSIVRKTAPGNGVLPGRSSKEPMKH